MATPRPEMLTIGQAAKRLGVSINTLRNWDRQGKLKSIRHPMNSYRLYAAEAIDELKGQMTSVSLNRASESISRAEGRFDIEFISPLALAEKQIQQSYRPYIQVHKWFARRPGSLFRALLIAEFGDEEPLNIAYFRSHQFDDRTMFDPFMGGGTPVVEANRLGMNVVGCDINPLAVWIVRQELADLDPASFRNRSEELASKCEAALRQYYQTTCKECGERADVKYFLWVKRLDCAGCGEEVELFPGYLIAGNARHPRYVFFCPICRDLFELVEMPERDALLTCPHCSGNFRNSSVAKRNKYVCQKCGHQGRYPKETASKGPPQHNMIAMEYFCRRCRPTHEGRFFKAPEEEDFGAYEEAAALFQVSDAKESVVPNDAIPEGDETKRLLRWGYRRFRELFNDRQLFGLSEVFKAVREVPEVETRHALATVFSDFLRYQNMLCRYDTYALKCQDIFAVHGFPVGLMQCENNVLGLKGAGAGGFRHFVEKFLSAKRYNQRPFETITRGRSKKRIPMNGEHIGASFTEGFPEPAKDRAAFVFCASSEDVRLPPESIDAVITDPPYYDNVQYAELMDFCYIWLRKLLKSDIPMMNGRTTKNEKELTGNRTANRDLLHFCQGISLAFQRAAEALKSGGLFAFTYHHNDIDAYLPLVVAFLDAGLSSTASLPCPAEMSVSLHIARTGSSVIDTILCARKASRIGENPAYQVAALPDLLWEQTATLRKAGIVPTEGDVRCMALGLLTVCCTNALQKAWNETFALEERLRIARDQFQQLLDRFPNGLEGLVRLGMQKRVKREAPYRIPQQMSLFPD